MLYFNDAGSQLQNTAKFMGRPIEYVDCTDLLGVSVTSRINERNVNSSVQKVYCRVNSVLYDFKDIPCDVKAKLLDSYCLDVYGSQLWNYSKHDVDMFFTAWRKSIRRLWKIPNTTNCNLLSSIKSSVPIVINLERKCASLFGLVCIVIILLLKQLLIRLNAVVYQILEIIIDISVISIR